MIQVRDEHHMLSLYVKPKNSIDTENRLVVTRGGGIGGKGSKGTNISYKINNSSDIMYSVATTVNNAMWPYWLAKRVNPKHSHHKGNIFFWLFEGMDVYPSFDHLQNMHMSSHCVNPTVLLVNTAQKNWEKIKPSLFSKKTRKLMVWPALHKCQSVKEIP